jgi:hypothetical protein
LRENKWNDWVSFKRAIQNYCLNGHLHNDLHLVIFACL